MAISLDALKSPFAGRSAGPAAQAAEAAPPSAAEADRGGLWLIGRLPIGRQLQVLIGALLVLLAVIAVLVFLDARHTHHVASRLAGASHIPDPHGSVCDLGLWFAIR